MKSIKKLSEIGVFSFKKDDNEDRPMSSQHLLLKIFEVLEGCQNNGLRMAPKPNSD